MNVLFTSHSGAIWGAEQSLLELIETLAANGVEPFLACPSGSPLADRAAQSGIEVLPLGLPAIARRMGPRRRLRGVGSLVRAVGRVATFIGRRRIDLAHANTTVAQFWTGPAARIAGVPCVWHWRDFYSGRTLHRALGTMADVSIAVSEPVLEFARGEMGAAGRIVLAQNGVRDRWTEETLRSRTWRPSLGIDDADIVVLMAGQAIPRKGQETLVRAIASICGRVPVRAVFAHPEDAGGLPPYLADLRDLSARLGCDRWITFAVPSGEIAPLLQEGDIVAVPSMREPFGRLAVEAMLARRPLVASNIDALRTIVEDGVTGVLVPPGDAEGLGEALFALASRPEIRQRMGRAGRQRALELFPIERTASRVLEVYRRLLRR